MNGVHDIRSRQGRQRLLRDQTRQAILDAALDLFVQHGYEHVSIRSIAAQVSFSPGALYRYFPSKDEIFFALAEEGLKRLNASDPANTPSADPLEDLRATARCFYEFSRSHPQLFALIFLDMRVPRISHEYGAFEFMGPIWEALEARVLRCIDAGLLPPNLHPFVALRLLCAPIFGIAAQKISGRLEPDEDVRALVEDAIEISLAGMRAGAQRLARPPHKPAAASELPPLEKTGGSKT